MIPHHLDTDLDPAFHFDADPDPTSVGTYFDADTVPTFYLYADPDFILHIKAPSLQNVLEKAYIL